MHVAQQASPRSRISASLAFINAGFAVRTSPKESPWFGQTATPHVLPFSPHSNVEASNCNAHLLAKGCRLSQVEIPQDQNNLVPPTR